MTEKADSSATAEHWWALAVHAFTVADGMTEPDARLNMLQIASGYDKLARHAELREGLSKKLERPNTFGIVGRP
jgi:hypothetical protein